MEPTQSDGLTESVMEESTENGPGYARPVCKKNQEGADKIQFHGE